MPRYQIGLYCTETYHYRATVIVEAPDAETAKAFVLDDDPADIMENHGKETGSDGYDYFGVADPIIEVTDDRDADYDATDVIDIEK